jgi:hypothetical protein
VRIGSNAHAWQSKAGKYAEKSRRSGLAITQHRRTSLVTTGPSLPICDPFPHLGMNTMEASFDPAPSETFRTSRAANRLAFVCIAVLALCAQGCGKKAEAVQAPVRKFAWAEGQYLGERYIPVPKNPPTTTDVAFKIANDAIVGKASQSIQNPSGGLPLYIECTFPFSGPLTETGEGNATFDISGSIPNQTEYHVTGTISRAGTAEIYLQSTSMAHVAELRPLESIGEKDMVPESVHAEPNGGMPAPVAKDKVKPFTMQSQGLAVKR